MDPVAGDHRHSLLSKHGRKRICALSTAADIFTVDPPGYLDGNPNRRPILSSPRLQNDIGSDDAVFLFGADAPGFFGLGDRFLEFHVGLVHRALDDADAPQLQVLTE